MFCTKYKYPKLPAGVVTGSGGSTATHDYSDTGETMDQKTMTIKCFRCQRQHLLLEMVMDASGKGMVCRPCAGLPPKDGKASAKPTIREQFARPKTPSRSNGKYACTNCKYRFSSSNPLDTLACPYCGSRRVSSPDQNSADALIKSAGSREFDF